MKGLKLDMLKRVLIGFLAALISMSFFVSLYSADVAEKQKMSEATYHLGMSFTLPVWPLLDDPVLVFSALESSALDSHVNVFRTSSGYDENNKPFTAHFVLLTSEQTSFFNSFRLRVGKPLSMDETQNGSYFMSTKATGNALQVGLIEDICRNDEISIYGLQNVYSSLPVSGRYTVEYEKQEQLNTFIDAFLQELEDAGVILTRDEILTGSDFMIRTVSDDPQVLNWVFIWSLVISITILTIYHQFYESKRAAVMLLQGSSILKVWYLITGQTIIYTLVGLMIISFITSLLVPGTSIEFIYTTILRTCQITIVTVVLSLVTLPYLYNLRPVEALKNRKDTAALVVLNLCVRSVISLVLIFNAITALTLFHEAKEATAKLGSWQATSQYGFFYPRSIGNDMEEALNGQLASTASEVYDLYPALNERGALFVNARMYEPMSMQQGLPEGAFRSVQVNPNYLSVYPVFDIDGDSIKVSENETDWILLVPIEYKADEEAILNYFATNRFGDSEQESLAEFEQRMFGREVSDSIKNQSIKLIWIANDQRLFSYNPTIAPEDGNCLVNQIVEVMTLNNSTAFDRINGITGDVGCGIKVKLINGDTKKTMEELGGLLRDLHLDDNLLHLVTLNDYALSELQLLHQGIQSSAVKILIISLIFVVLVLQSATILFEESVRRVIIRKLLGYPFFTRHSSYFIYSIMTWFILCAVALNLMSLPILLIDLPIANTTDALIVVGIVFTIEIMVSALALRFIESRRMPSVIKGEF
ncbi:MAG: DUF1430 domain-containing protein [Coriobacteriales bacterium]|jgi:bacteriocin-associated integral membrane protein|nr:DUF1430 domain-containing protein [Coriobacteriales bacterium]